MKLTEKLRNLSEKASSELDKICKDRHGFRMSIPVKDDDSDIVLSNALNALNLAAGIIDVMKEALEKTRSMEPVWPPYIADQALARVAELEKGEG